MTDVMVDWIADIVFALLSVAAFAIGWNLDWRRR